VAYSVYQLRCPGFPGKDSMVIHVVRLWTGLNALTACWVVGCRDLGCERPGFVESDKFRGRLCDLQLLIKVHDSGLVTCALVVLWMYALEPEFVDI
jgi:hypothetical protein